MLTNCIEPLQIQNSLRHLLLRSGEEDGHNQLVNVKPELHQFQRQFVAQITKLLRL
jgi:hypothetical protein